MDIKKMVVPVDFGKNTIKLVEFALYLAKKLSAEIRFCHVIEPLGAADMMLGSPSFADFQEKMQEGAKERMANVITDTKAMDISCKGDVLFGDTVDKILAYAKGEGADLIVIGTHGAKGLEKILLGSVAERVVKRSHCPCLVLNPYK